MVAKKLDKKLRENLWDARNNLFHGNTGQTGSFSFTRPMLILLDRNIDMATPLHHTWTYQALAHDVLDLSLNRYVLYYFEINFQSPYNIKKKIKSLSTSLFFCFGSYTAHLLHWLMTVKGRGAPIWSSMASSN